MDEDKQWILKFIEGVENFMEIMVENIHLLAPGQKDVYSLVRESWKEVRVILNNVGIQINKEKIDPERLKIVGLSGPQLALKYRVYEREKETFDKEWREVEKKSDQERNSWWTRKKRSLLLRLIKVIDNLLDSLSAVVPPLHAVKEFKDTLESIVKRG